MRPMSSRATDGGFIEKSAFSGVVAEGHDVDAVDDGPVTIHLRCRAGGEVHRQVRPKHVADGRRHALDQTRIARDVVDAR